MMLPSRLVILLTRLPATLFCTSRRQTLIVTGADFEFLLHFYGLHSILTFDPKRQQSVFLHTAAADAFSFQDRSLPTPEMVVMC